MSASSDRDRPRAVAGRVPELDTATEQQLARGGRCMLYTDLANPAPNSVYQRVGYRRNGRCGESSVPVCLTAIRVENLGKHLVRCAGGGKSMAEGESRPGLLPTQPGSPSGH